MKLLLIHSDFIEFEAKEKALKSAEEAKKGRQRIEDCLVVFCTTEENDSENVIEKTVEEIENVAGQVGAKRIVVYPFVHLSKTPAKPDFALKSLEKIKADLSKNFEVVRAPFGWYKSFTIKCKGHPLSELSREISEKAEEKSVTAKSVSGKAHLTKEKLSEFDHRILAQKLDLFSFQETAPGMVFFHPKGMIVRNELINFWRKEHIKNGYKEILTPQIMNKSLWQLSGHWEHYKDNMFFTSIDGVDFALKPMNCPGAILVFKNSQKSYKDLPLKLAELGVVHRNELSGVLSGMFRLRQFTQDDAHIFVTPDQLEKEIEKVVEMINFFYKTLGFEYRVELSTRPEKRMGDEKLWDKAENSLENSLKKKKMNYKINKGDGAFYGPKIDFHIKDSLGRSWQCATVQVDFQMPERFDASFTGEDGKQQRPVIIHRVIYGSIERFIGILVEHFKGAFPLWLSPVQVRVISFTDKNIQSAQKIIDKLLENGIRADSDFESNTIDYKIRESQTQKIPYTIVIGDKEEQNNTISVRKYAEKKAEFGKKLDKFIELLKTQIKAKN